MLIEIAEPGNRPETGVLKAIHSGPYRKTADRLGRITPISLHQQDDGSVSIHVITRAAGGAPSMTYTHRPDGTIHMTKHNNPHHGSITGTDQDPEEELLKETREILTQEMARSPAARRALAKAITKTQHAATAWDNIATAAFQIVTKSLQKQEPDNQNDRLQDTINMAITKYGIQEALTRAVRKHITNDEILSLIPGIKNQAQLNDQKYNLMAPAKAELLALHATNRDTLSYHLTHTWRPEKGESLPTTQETLEQAIADTLRCTGAARSLLIQGLRDGTWSKLKPDDVSRICRFAGLLGNGKPKPATINAVRELRNQIPDPRLIKKATENRLYSTEGTQLGKLQYLLRVLHIYDMNHDPRPERSGPEVDESQSRGDRAQTLRPPATQPRHNLGTNQGRIDAPRNQPTSPQARRRFIPHHLIRPASNTNLPPPAQRRRMLRITRPRPPSNHAPPSRSHRKPPTSAPCPSWTGSSCAVRPAYPTCPPRTSPTSKPTTGSPSTPPESTKAGWPKYGRKSQENSGRDHMLRYDFCAPLETKIRMSSGMPAFHPDMTNFILDDPRAYDILWEYPRENVPIHQRPWIQAQIQDSYPVEYRVFVRQGVIQGISNYYPQRPLRRNDNEIERARELTLALVENASTPFLWPNSVMNPWVFARYGADGTHFTADFIVTETGDMLLLEGGPPHEMGAHPCCFRDGELSGIALTDRNAAE